MPELAINGGTPVRSTGYPAWPAPDDEYVAAVTDVVRSGEWGGFPEPGRHARRVRGGVRRLSGSGARDLDDERDGDDGGRLQGARHRLGRRGDRPGTDVRRDRLRPDGGRRPAGLRRRHAGDLDDRPRSGGGGHHGAHEGDPPGAPRPPDGRHGPDHGDRRRARTRGDRGLRARARPAVEGAGRRMHRRLRFLQPPVLEDPDLRGGRHAAHGRRGARAPRALASSIAAGRRMPRRRSTRSAPTTG